MEVPPLRWQRALLYTLVLLIAGSVCLLLVSSPRLQRLISCGIMFASSTLAMVWMLRSRRNIHLKRERRVWSLIIVSMVLAALAHLYHTLGPPHSPLTALPEDLVTLASYGIIWVALLMRSGKYPQDALAKGLLWCDLIIIVWASTTLAYYLAARASDILGASFIQRIVGIGYPFLGIMTLVVVSLMLFRAVARSWQGPRGLLAIGLLLVFVGDILGRFTPHIPGAVFLTLLGTAGMLCYGISALWEASLYAERSLRSQVIDPFPSLSGMLIPALLVMASLGFTLMTVAQQRDVSDGASTLAMLANMAILVLLITVRHVLTFENHRQLYRSLQQLYAEMAQHAATDPLTNLANHRYFMDRLRKEVRRAVRYQRPLALIFCDLDHFKRINDTYGHVMGDQALCGMANSLREGVRELDTVARYGGEEFVILLPETTLPQAEFLAERLREKLQDLVIPHRQGGVITVTMSCGVSSYPETADSMETLLSSADHAMYQAKGEGRNCVVSAPPSMATSPHKRPL